MSTLRQRRPRVVLDGYRKFLTTQPCIVSGYVMSSEGGPGVDPAHLSMGNLARGMKADDWLCVPLKHDLHLECDRNQYRFWLDALGDKSLLATVMKDHARMNYLRWVSARGGDVEAAVRECE